MENEKLTELEDYQLCLEDILGKLRGAKNLASRLVKTKNPSKLPGSVLKKILAGLNIIPDLLAFPEVENTFELNLALVSVTTALASSGKNSNSPGTDARTILLPSGANIGKIDENTLGISNLDQGQIEKLKRLLSGTSGFKSHSTELASELDKAISHLETLATEHADQIKLLRKDTKKSARLAAPKEEEPEPFEEPPQKSHRFIHSLVRSVLPIWQKNLDILEKRLKEIDWDVKCAEVHLKAIKQDSHSASPRDKESYTLSIAALTANMDSLQKVKNKIEEEIQGYRQAIKQCT